MKTRSLDGDINKWKIESSLIRGSDERPRSKLHLAARSLLKEIYPTLQICEEISVRIRRDKRAIIDFYINTIKTVVEVHGEQHYKFNSLYHTCAQDFLNQKKRDTELIDWCVLNNLNYVELPFNEGRKQWKTRIQLKNS
jgi:hypothetical protein